MEFPNNAQYRLGGLTLAVGLGLAVTSGQGVANAAPDSDGGASSSESSTGSSGPASPGGPAQSDAADTTGATGSSTRASTAPSRKPLSSLSASGGANTSTSADRLERLKTLAQPRTIGTSTRPSSSLSASGGANTSTSADRPAATMPTDIATDAEPSDPTPDADATTPTPDLEVETPPEPTEAPPAAEPSPQADPVRTPVEGVPADSDDSPSDSTPEPISLALTQVNKLPSLTFATTAARLVTVSGQTMARAEKLAAAQIVSATNDASVVPVVPPNPPDALTAGQALVPTAALVAAPTRILGGLLSWVGFTPSAVTPHAPIAPTKLLELAWVALRRTFLNTTPTATVVVGQPNSSGVITGSVVGADADGDPLTYSVTDAPARGTLTIDETTGAFTYTPDAALAETGGLVTFEVAVTDKGPHIHGLRGLFTPGGNHGTTATVNLTIPPGNDAPVSGTPPYTVDHGDIDHNTGAVRGTVNITDPDGNTLTYTVSQPDPQVGTVAVNSTTGAWTFTPTGQTRLDATASGSPQTTQFTITASDGRESTSVTVTAPIDPAQAAIVEVIEVPGTPTSVDVTLDGTIIVIGTPNVVTVVLPDTTVTNIPVTFNPGSIWIDKPTDTTYIVTEDNAIYTLDIDTTSMQVVDTGIRLDHPVNDVAMSGGTLIVSSGGTLQGFNGSQQLEVRGLPADYEFQQVKVTGPDTVVATSQHAVSRLAVSMDLGEARMMGANSSAGGTVTFEEIGRIDFGEATVTAVSYHDQRMVALITENGEDQLVLIDPRGGMEEMDRFTVGSGATSVTLNNDLAYITNATAGTVTVVDVYTQEVLATINTGSTGGVAALPGGGAVVANPGAGTVMTIGHAVPQD